MQEPHRSFLRRHRVKIGAGLFIVFVLSIIAFDLRVGSFADGRITRDVEEVTPVDVAVVLGTSPGARSNPNLYFSLRMDAAAELFHARKVRALLVSGANSSIHYNETKAMEDALVKRGVPRNAITRDEFGWRTLDSIVRAKKIYGLQKFIVVSQQFHVERSLFLADHFGLQATGFATEKIPMSQYFPVRARELLARTRATFDVLWGTQPHSLGEPQHMRIPHSPG